MRGGIAAILVLMAVLTGACDGAPSSSDEPAGEQTLLGRALRRTREAGNARTVTTLPEGMLATLEISGVVDFRRRHSDTLLHVVKEDGQRLRYQRLVRTPEGELLGRYLGENQDEPAWQRVGRPSERPGFGVIWDGVTLLDAVETQDAHLAPEEDTGSRFVRVEPTPSERPAIWIHVVELDGQSRIQRIEYELTSTDGRIVMTFADYGEAPPIEVPDADV